MGEGLERSALGTPAASFSEGLDMRIIVAVVAAAIGCVVLAGCFHHGQTSVVEYSPPPLSRAPYK